MEFEASGKQTRMNQAGVGEGGGGGGGGEIVGFDDY